MRCVAMQSAVGSDSVGSPTASRVHSTMPVPLTVPARPDDVTSHGAAEEPDREPDALRTMFYYNRVYTPAVNPLWYNLYC